MTTNNGSIVNLPLSTNQQQFWLLNQIHPNGSAYNVPSLFRIKGYLDISALEKSINAIMARHEIFRTCFTVDSDVFQNVHPQIKINIDVEKFETLNEDSVNNLIQNEVEKPFNLALLPLIRVKVFQLSREDFFLLINMHHIITDLRTKDLFADELELFYNANIDNETAEPKDVLNQYADYSKLQAEWMTTDEYSSMLYFWKKKLEGHEGILDLPLENNRPAIQGQKGKTWPIDIDKRLTHELRLFSRKNNVSIYLTLLAAYYVLLFRYSGQKELIIGVPLTNRRRAELKNTMGCFVNTIPLAISFTENENFKEILRKVRVAMLEGHRNQEAPFISIVNHANPKKDSSYNPLFQAGFTFEHPMSLALSGVDVAPVYVHNGGAQLDSFVTFWELENEVRGVFEYNADLFDDSFAKRISDSYLSLLNGILNEDDLRISRLSILTDFDKEKMLVDWNATNDELSDICCVHSMFEEQARKTPNAVAVQFQEEYLTYYELNQKANQLATFLCLKEGAFGDLIGIFMDRSLEMLVALLGVLKAGRTYVPIDPHFPLERIRYMISHSGAVAVLTTEKLKKSLPVKNINIYINSEWKNSKHEKLDIEVTPDNLAYVIYTSGSTGNPKGVQVQHGAIVNFLNSMAKSPGMNDQDVLLAVTTLSFDIAVLELFLPLTVGGETIIATREDAADGAALLDAVSKYGVTVIQATPVTFRLLINAGWKGEPSLKVLCGGEAMPIDLAEKLVERSNEVWNMYGPTETTIWSTCCQISNVKGSVSIGKPIANTKVFILNDFMQPVPIGVSGNLFIGGVGVTFGYINQLELTEQKFINNPFSMGSDEKLYNTGDIAKYKRDGSIELVGRSDFQLKIRGFRIEAGEIETLLDRYPGIVQTAVSIHKYDEDDSRLIAYYTQANNSAMSIVKLRNYLASKLPEYMIPSVFIQVDSMSLTPNGKVDKKNLPNPEKKRPELEHDFIPPQNQFEKTLSNIWCEILKIESVGVNDKFFEIGGTSLLAVKIVNQIKKKLNINIQVIKIFQYPTISSLAGFLKSGDESRVMQKRNENLAMLRKKSLKHIRLRASLKR